MLLLFVSQAFVAVVAVAVHEVVGLVAMELLLSQVVVTEMEGWVLPLKLEIEVAMVLSPPFSLLVSVFSQAARTSTPLLLCLHLFTFS